MCVCEQAGTPFLVCDVPNDLSPQTYLIEAAQEHGHPWETLFWQWPTFHCYVNGLLHDCFRPLPAYADVVSIHVEPYATVSPHHGDFLSSVVRPLAVVTGPSVDRPIRPPTPPVPGHRWERRLSRTMPGSPISIGGTPEEVPLTAEGSQSQASEDVVFAVFDVYHHARIIPCKQWHTPAQQADIALEQTPEIARQVAHFRAVRSLLPGLPTRQVVLWGDVLPNAVILPVAFHTDIASICTLEAPRYYTAVQLGTLACRRCQLPDHIIQSVIDLDLRVLINGHAVYPLDTDSCVAADTAQVQGNLFRALLPSANPVSSQSSSSGLSEVREFLQTLPLRPGEPRIFTVFCVGEVPHELDIPAGASTADLVYTAFQRFPQTGARCGHRQLQQPIPGYAPLQTCIWGEIGIDDHVVQVVTVGNPVSVATICAPRSATPVEIAALAGGSRLSNSVATRRTHMTLNGRPCQPREAFVN